MFARAGSLLGTQVQSAARLSGGDLSSVSRIVLADGRSAIAKHGSKVAMEAVMLETMRVNNVPVPHILAVENGLLILEELPASGRITRSWSHLAEVLDHLHVPASQHYGWPQDYGFGPVDIANARSTDWVEFWADNRLRCHLAHVEPHLAHRIARLADRLGDFLPKAPRPALLHGDL